MDIIDFGLFQIMSDLQQISAVLLNLSLKLCAICQKIQNNTKSTCIIRINMLQWEQRRSACRFSKKPLRG